MKRLRELSLLLNLVGVLILVVWGLYKLVGGLIPGLGSLVNIISRNFFANATIPMPVKLSVPMVILGVILFFLSGSGQKGKAGEEKE